MSKYAKAVQKVKQEQDFDEKQKKLHEKYEIPDNIIIKEKSNMFKFTVKMIRGILRFSAAAILLVLAVLGLTAVLYPAPRNELILILKEVFDEIIKMVN